MISIKGDGETLKTYEKYLETKMETAIPSGMEPGDLNSKLFEYQKDLVKWALKRGRAALFTDTGTGKTFMQVEWAKQVSEKGRVLILAPLAVGEQTVQEARKLGVKIKYCREDEGELITITNYEMLDAFDVSKFAGVVLDESSILKSYSGRIRTALIEAFQKTPFRLACTATPSPNDYTELGNHSEFLGIKTRSEMLAEYFVHDMDNTQDWRLKGHAIEPFWKWVSSWAAMLKKPSDLGYSDDGFKLPKLTIEERIIPSTHSDFWAEGYLFAPDAKTLSDQRASRRGTMAKRIEIAKELSKGNEPVLIWCELNDEGDLLEKAIKGSVQVKGNDTLEEKKSRLLGFANGDFRVLVTKAKIAGFGMNWQHCNKMIFMGASHSYEGTYQAIRRCWRFGQKKPVDVTIICSENETSILNNLKRKSDDAEKMGQEMTARVCEVLKAEITGTKKEWNEYKPTKTMKVPSWIGDEIEKPVIHKVSA